MGVRFPPAPPIQKEKMLWQLNLVVVKMNIKTKGTAKTKEFTTNSSKMVVDIAAPFVIRANNKIIFD